MKKFYTLLTIVPLGWLAAIADGETPYQEMDYRYITQDGTTNWSAASWGIYPGASGGEAVDYDANSSAGVTQGSDSIINMLGTASGGADGVINIDTDYIYSEKGPSSSGADSETMRWAIYIGIGNEHSQSKWNNNPEAKLTFDGGTINIDHPSDSSVASGIRFYGTGAPSTESDLTEPLKKTITFTETNTINSSTALIFQGATAETILGVDNSCSYVTLNLNGTIYVRENTTPDEERPFYEYKNLTFKSDTAPTPYTAHYNIGGVIEAGSWTD